MNRPTLPLSLLACVFACVCACGPGEDLSLPECATQLCTSDDATDGLLVTVVHAPDKDEAVLFSFAAPDEPASTDAWDLGFARTTITVNGGTSGDGNVEVAMLDDRTLDAIGPDDVPSEGWFTDESGELAFERGDKWYEYDLGRHVIEVRPRVYFVRATDGVVYGVEFISYYDREGESRYPTFRWLALTE